MYKLFTGCSDKEFEKFLPQNASKQEEEKSGLEFNPDLELICL